MEAFYYEHSVPAYPGFETGMYQLGLSGQTRLHWHSFLILEFVTEGRGMHYISGSEEPIERGSAWLSLSGPMYAHRVRNTGDSMLKIINLSVLDTVPNQMLLRQMELHGSATCILDEQDTVFFCDVVRRLSEEHTGLPGSVPLVSALTDSLFLLMLRRAGCLKPIPNLIDEAVKSAKDRVMDGITLTDLARELSVTPNYLGRLFHEKTGKTFSDYLMDLRLQRACDLLTANHTVKEAAFSSGFSSVEYFCVIFKKRMGMTPGEWKNTILPPDSEKDI